MIFKPKSEHELATDDLFPAGQYDFEVRNADEAVSKTSGADMIKLELYVFRPDGERRIVYDYLVGTEGGQRKIRGFSAAVGLLAQYEKGELLAVDMVQRTGQLKLRVETDKTGQFPDKNSVADYLKPKAAPASVAQPVSRSLRPSPAAEARKPVPAGAGGGDLDDEIPFGPCWQ
jgi:hypothetical protein